MTLTTEELEALPVGSIVRSKDHYLYLRTHTEWVEYDEVGGGLDSEDLYEPTHIARPLPSWEDS